MPKDLKIALFSLLGTAAAVGAFLYLRFRAKAAAFAKQWIGVSEQGANTSFADGVFQAMMQEVGWKSGEAWCMYLAKAVHAASFKADRDKIIKILTGSTQQSWNNAKNDTTNTYEVIESGNPKLGDIAIYQSTTNSGLGHAGIVIAHKGNTFTTVEGNTNQAGSRSGDSVLKKERPLAYKKTIPNSTLKLLGFIRKKR